MYTACYGQWRSSGRLVRWQADHGKVDTSYEFVMSQIRDMRGVEGTVMRIYEDKKNLHIFFFSALILLTFYFPHFFTFVLPSQLIPAVGEAR